MASRPSLGASRTALAGCVITFWIAVFQALGLAIRYGYIGYDFKEFRAIAFLPGRFGWPALYNAQAQLSTMTAVGTPPRTHDAIARLFLAPPPLLWLMLPFTKLPEAAGVVIWFASMVLCFAIVWWLVAPGRGLARYAMLFAIFGFFPISNALFMEQPTAFEMLGLTLAYVALVNKREVAAGAALSVIILKPQNSFLVPVVLLVAGYWRVFVSWLVLSLALAAVSLAMIGPHAVIDLMQLDRLTAGMANNFGPISWLVGPQHALPVELFGIGVALLIARPMRRLGVEAVFVLGIVASLATGPYQHYHDLSLLVLVGWLALRADLLPRFGIAWVLAVWAAADLSPLVFNAFDWSAIQLALWSCGIGGMLWHSLHTRQEAPGMEPLNSGTQDASPPSSNPSAAPMRT